MSRKPTHSSVTDLPCTCSYLQTAADDPENPIAFDARTGEFEFHYTCGTGEDAYPATLVIYHCPFCGGAAPESKRPLLFARIINEEVERLTAVLEPIKTAADALRVLGKPDYDGLSISRRNESDDSPSTVERDRYFYFDRLSETARVWFQVMPDDKVYWQLHGKQLWVAD